MTDRAETLEPSREFTMLGNLVVSYYIDLPHSNKKLDITTQSW